MTIIKETKPRKVRNYEENMRKRYRIFSTFYKTEYTNSLLMAYIHYYGARLVFGGPGKIMDTFSTPETLWEKTDVQ